MPTINATTAAITLTENSSTINAKRGVATSTEAITLTENSSTINAERGVAASTEVISLTANPANVLMSGYLADSINVSGLSSQATENTLLSETIQISENTFPGVVALLADNTFVIDDDLAVVWNPAPLVDTINVSEEVSYSITSYITSIAKVVSAFGSIGQTTSLRSRIKVSDSNSIVMVALLADVLTVTDTRELAVIANLVSNLTAEGTFTDSLVGNATISDTFQMRDSQAVGFAEYLVSTGLFSSSLEDLRTQIELLSDSMTLTDAQVLSATVLESLSDTAQFSDQLGFAGSAYNVVLVSTLEMGDVLWSPDFGSIAWVMNTEGLSIAPYSNYGFHSIAEHAGKVFAVSPEGVFELTGDTDNGRKIDAHLKGGFDDFGSPNRKRASDLYMSYTGGNLECAIETYDGPKTVYNYPIEEREADAPRNNRMKVGRGLVSRYWRTEVRNLTGADFKVYEIGLNTVTSKRRL